MGWMRPGGLWISWGVGWLVSVLLVARPGFTEEVQTAAADTATVRVLCMGSVGIDRVQIDGAKFTLAAPASARRSGFAVSEDGLVVTTPEELALARAVIVHVPGVDGALPASVVGVSEGVAFLSVAHRFQRALAQAEQSAPLEVRQRVFAVGYPLALGLLEPQVSRGAVAKHLGDGSWGLNLGLSAGFSGGPLLDEKGRVVGVLQAPLEARRKTLVGVGEVTTLTQATPVSSFREPLETLRAGPARTAPSAAEQNVATLLSLVVAESDAVLTGGIRVHSQAGLEAERWVRQSLQEPAVTADAALLAAAFFWNRHVSLQLQKLDHVPAFNNAIKLVRFAFELDGSIQERSPFAKHVLSQPVENPPDPLTKPKSLDSGDADSPEIQFQPDGPELSLHVRYGSSFQERRYRQLCQGPCAHAVESGRYWLAVSKGDQKPIDVDEPTDITSPTVVAATYKSRRVLRIIGWSVLGGGSLTGLVYVLSSHQSCAENDGLVCEYPNLKEGSLLIAGSIVAGLIMGLKSDSIEVDVFPALEPRATSGREQLQGVGTATHGATLRVRF